MKIELIGHVDIDHNRSEGVTYTAAGSTPMFMHRVLRRFQDVRVGVISSYGADFVPYLQAQGVDIYPTEPNAKGDTLVYENRSFPDGTRTQRAYNRDEARVVPLDALLRVRLSETDLVLFDPTLPNISPRYYEEVTRAVRKDALKVLLPQGHYRDFDEGNNVIPREFVEDKLVLPNIDLVIVSEQDGSNMLSTAKEWAQRYGLISVITLGAEGAVAFTETGEIRLKTAASPALSVRG